MKTIRRFAAITALAVLSSGTASSPVLAGEGTDFDFPIEQYRLSNGLQVILQEDHTVPTVTVNIWYHVGSKDEPPHRNGFAHLFEHLMFQGSKHVGEDQYFRFLERAGATHVNGTTALNRTNYYETVPSNQLALALWLESDRMGFLLDHVDQKTFESQRQVVLNERRQSYVDRPYGMVSKFLREALYPVGHPYHNLTIGSPEDLHAATLEDVHAFYKRFYVPNNASLVLVGDFVPSQAKELIEKYFGPIQKQADPHVVTQPRPAGLAKQVILHVEAGVQLPRVYITYDTPPFFARGDADLDGLSRVLTGGKSSRLYKSLVYDKQIAKDITAYQASGQIASEFDIIATASPGHTAEELLRAIDVELKRLAAAPPTADEVQRARANMMSRLVFEAEKQYERADMLNSYAQYAGRPDYFSKDIARYRNLTSQSILRAAQEWIIDKPRVVALVTPNPKAPASGILKGTK